MRLHVLLSGAAAAALLATGVTVASVVTDPTVRSCGAALDAAEAANAALIDTYGPLDRAEVRARHDGDAAAGVVEARLLVKQRQLELDAARVTVSRLCHVDRP